MTRIRLLVSDVDGTLLTRDRTLRASVRDAVHRLHRADVLFSLVSARPPRGEGGLAAGLGVRCPIGCLNGGVLAMPDLSIVEQHAIAAETGAQALGIFQQSSLDIWAYTATAWFVGNPKGDHVEEEMRLVHFAPRVTRDFAWMLPAAIKLVGVYDDKKLLERTAAELSAALGDQARIGTSKNCFLEVFAPQSNKGAVVSYFCKRFGLTPESVASIGDGENDLAMFERSGLSIAMGTASASVKARASHVTASAEEDGFYRAVEDFILPAAVSSPARARR